MSTTVSSINTLPVPTPVRHSSVFHGAGPSQTIGTSHNATPSQQSLASGPPVVTSLPHLPEVGEVCGGYPLNVILNPPDIPVYYLLFLHWLQARRAWMVNQGYGDPVLVGASFLAQRFNEWVREWWPLFHFLRLGTPVTNPSGWAGIFDFWFITLRPDHISSAPPSHTTPATSTALTTPYQPPSDAIASSASAALASRNKKHYRSKKSTLTVEQIQHGCIVAGGEAQAIQRLAVVFPSGSVVVRDALIVGQRRRVGHRGYQEFTGPLDGRWYCRLCKTTGARTWKNEKDILNHVWNEHCNLS